MISEKLYQEIHKNMPITCVDIILKTLEYGFILIKRNKEPAKGQWWLSGGRIFKDERLEDAAKRKVKEETNLEVRTLKKVGVYETIFKEDPFGHGKGTHTINICYLAEITDSGELNLDKNHSRHKVFYKINESWHPYIKTCLKDAGF